MVQFGQFLKSWSLWSNSVTRQVSLNRTKIGGKYPNSNGTFWVIFKQLCDIWKFSHPLLVMWILLSLQNVWAINWVISGRCNKSSEIMYPTCNLLSASWRISDAASGFFCSCCKMRSPVAASWSPGMLLALLAKLCVVDEALKGAAKVSTSSKVDAISILCRKWGFNWPHFSNLTINFEALTSTSLKVFFFFHFLKETRTDAAFGGWCEACGAKLASLAFWLPTMANAGKNFRQKKNLNPKIFRA